MAAVSWVRLTLARPSSTSSYLHEGRLLDVFSQKLLVSTLKRLLASPQGLNERIAEHGLRLKTSLEKALSAGSKVARGPAVGPEEL